ncbi:unnamed protein product, partial [Musa hybrid cultivar]
MVAFSFVVRSRVSARTILMVLRPSKKQITELEASPSMRLVASLRRRNFIFTRARLLLVVKITGEFALLGVDAASPHCDCLRSSAFGSRRGVPTMGISSTR